MAAGSVLSALADGVIAGMDAMTTPLIINFGIGSIVMLWLAVTSRAWMHVAVMSLFLLGQVIFYTGELEQISTRFLEVSAP